MLSITTIENQLKHFLQREVQIAIENKILKQGRLILFNIKDFFCVLTLVCNGKHVVYELSYPFNLQFHNNQLIFDYTLSSFSRKSEEIQQMLSVLNIKKPSKFYNKKVTLTAI